MLGKAGTEKLFPLKMLDGAGIKNHLEVNMLGGAGTKKIFLLKILNGTCIKKLL